MAFRAVLLTLVFCAIPSASWAEIGCVCVGPSLEERIEGADGVFLGYALDQTERSGSRRGTLLETIFLIETSWKGPAQDSIGVRSLLTGNCGARYVVGERYVVIAERDPYGFRQFGCYGALRADLANATLEALGKPVWSAPEPGQREIDAGPLRAPKSAGDRVALQGQVMDHDWNRVAEVKVSIAGRVATSDSAGGFWIPGLSPGLHLARLRLPNGSVEHHYMMLRCGQHRLSECRLYARRFVVEYEVPVADEPRTPLEYRPPRPTSPLDSLEAVRLLRESFAALEISETLQEDEAFRRHLGNLFEKWGVELPFSLRTAAEPLDSLLEADRLEEAILLARAESDPRSYRNRLGTVLRHLAQTGRWEQALRLSDSLGHADLGVNRVLGASEDSPEWKSTAEAVEGFIQSLADTTEIEFMWYDLVDFLALHDPQAAWNLAELRLTSADRVEAQLDLLWLEPDLEPWPPDSLVLETYARIHALAEAEDRDRLAGNLQLLCDRTDLEGCGQFVFPPTDQAPTPSALADLLSATLSEGRFEEARAIGDNLRELMTAERYALLVAQGLWRVFRYGPCLLHEPCAEAYRSERAALLPLLDRVAAETRGSVTDSLNAELAGLWASVEPDRAWEAIRRVDSEVSRSDGLARIAEATFDTDFEVAFAALLERGSAESTGIYLRNTYLDFKSRGHEERARQTLNLVAGVERMRMRLKWAERLARENRSEARRLALAALEDWDPETEQMRGWTGQFSSFFTLGTFEDLIEWARALEDPDDRAAALAAVVGSVTRW